MTVKAVALVFIITLALTNLLLGLKHTDNRGQHSLIHENGPINVGRGTAGQLHTADNLGQRESNAATHKKNHLHENALFRAKKTREMAKNEWLVKELALSSDIGEVKRSKVRKRNKKHGILKRVHHKRKTLGNKGASIHGAPTVNAKSQKRTSILFPSDIRGGSMLEHGAPISRTLLTAVGLLLNEKNHFEKDINALTLAKVLNDNAGKEQTNVGSDSHNTPTSLGALSNILRLLNTSLSQETPGGERKSTIHTELINPTELGVSILKLLFGHKAPLVVKPTFKPSLVYKPTTKASPRANAVLSHARLASQMNEFLNGKALVKKKYHRQSFTFALAKAVSDLIKSMAKQELKNYLRKIHNQHKLFNEMQYARIPTSFGLSKETVDVKGNRKSWVLLKIPKSGDEATLQQEMSDEPPEEKQSNEQKSSTGIVDTLGKLNKADPLPLEIPPGKVTGGSSLSGENSDAKPTSRVGYSVRILPSLKGSVGKQTYTLRMNAKPAKNSHPSPQTTAAFAEAVKKLLQAVQSSIKTLQGKQLIGHPLDAPAMVSDEPSRINQQHVASIVSDEPPKIPERTNTASVRGITSNLSPINNFQQYQKQSFLEDLHVKRQPIIGEPSSLTRAAGKNDLPYNGNALVDPLRDLELAASEPISKTISPAKRIGPTNDVVFESDTELGTTRDKQESSMVKHIKEDLEIFAEKGLQEHNHFRELHHSPHLRWSDELATQAEKMAYEMAMRGTVEKSELPTSLGYGENVAKITGVPFNDAGSVATDIWYSESGNYSYSYPHVTPQTDAFTQLVWKETKEVGMGCAKDVATNDLYVVALYRPPGNDRSRLRDNVINKGTMTEDVYATIFKRTKQD